MQRIRQFFEKSLRYWRGILSSLRRLKPHALLKAIADSDDVIKVVRPYNFSIVLNVNDKFIGRPILLKSSYEENVTRILLEQLKPNVHFLDIGANIGYYSLLVASQCPTATIVSFEPDSTNFKLFQTSIAYNRFESMIQAHQLAVSDRNDEMVLFDLAASQNSGAKLTAQDRESLGLFAQDANGQIQSIKAVQLDSFLANTPLDLVKIDIEGHEPFAIKGMVNLLTQHKPVMIVEFSPLSLAQIGKTTPERFLQDFVELGYHLAIIPPSGAPIRCGQDIAAVIGYFQTQTTNHIDLLLRVDG